jgi:hypothetical protein
MQGTLILRSVSAAKFDEEGIMNSKNFMKSVLAVVILIFTSSCFAADAGQSEIDHLLQYVENTNCKYERNGTKYSGRDAAAHIKKKYAYFKDKIDSTEDFIEYSAAKSEMSGKPYTIFCPGQPVINSRDWLLRELNRFRQKK